VKPSGLVAAGVPVLAALAPSAELGPVGGLVSPARLAERPGQIAGSPFSGQPKRRAFVTVCLCLPSHARDAERVRRPQLAICVVAGSMKGG